MTNKTVVNSSAQSIVDHIHDWWFGTKDDEYTSMSILSDNNPYGIEKGIFFSFPCIIKDSKIQIVRNLNLSEEDMKHLKTCEQELVDEENLILL